jgi:hypothetical protein
MVFSVIGCGYGYGSEVFPYHGVGNIDRQVQTIWTAPVQTLCATPKYVVTCDRPTSGFVVDVVPGGAANTTKSGMQTDCRYNDLR